MIASAYLASPEMYQHLTGAQLKDNLVAAEKATIKTTQAVELVEPAGCPRFAGRVDARDRPNGNVTILDD